MASLSNVLEFLVVFAGMVSMGGEWAGGGRWGGGEGGRGIGRREGGERGTGGRESEKGCGGERDRWMEGRVRRDVEERGQVEGRVRRDVEERGQVVCMRLVRNCVGGAPKGSYLFYYYRGCFLMDSFIFR